MRTRHDLIWMDEVGGHGGDINIYPEEGIKIWRNRDSMKDGMLKGDRELPLTLTTPSGKVHQLGPLDTVQVFARDRKGRINPHKSEAFQGAHMKMPKGYTVTDIREAFSNMYTRTDEPQISPEDMEIERPYSDFYGEIDDAAYTKDLPGRATRHNPLLDKLSVVATFFQKRSYEQHQRIEVPSQSDSRIVFRIYPFFGRKVNVLTLAGDLLTGRAGDRIEVVRRTDIGRFEVDETTTLGRLAKGEHGCFEL